MYVKRLSKLFTVSEKSESEQATEEVAGLLQDSTEKI
jgi:hypothetical protein